jgi:deoxyribodipyrimidine photo-lyase
MRMLWGKGIVAWSATPEEALARLVHLNNAYALDGRDPNSYTGIYWCLGKFDRPWPPARPPFGITRSMSTKNARKKLAMERYLARHGKL